MIVSRKNPRMVRRYRALVFDLFDTVVLFSPRVPTIQVAGTTWRSTLGWLREHIERDLPQVPFDDFLAAMSEVTGEIVRARHPQYYEVPSRERFRRVLARLGHDHAAAAATAERLSLGHMAHLAASTAMPPAHAELLRRLRRSFALGLVSNFDHGPTALAILAQHDIADLFSSTVISAFFGRRKPHPDIYGEVLRQLDCAPHEVLFIGDTLDDDVGGPLAAGMDAVWLNSRSAPGTEGAPTPTYTVRELTELAVLLGLER